jgi:HD-like signal output (HDOD) protein
VKYRIERTIGKGGMATVYLATLPGRSKPIALKIMKVDDEPLTGDPEATALMKDAQSMERFKREAQVLRKLKCPHIVRILDFGRADGDAYLAMEYVPGGDLGAVIGSGLPAKQALKLTRQIAVALGVAHQAEVIHRDVKPANILFRDADNVVLTDFGIAQVNAEVALTHTGVMMGSPCYASPEQLNAERIDGRTDLYSLGLVLFEMLMGKRAVEGTTPMQVIMRQLRGPTPLLREDLSALQPLIDRMLAKDVQERFADMHELIQHLDAFRTYDFAADVSVEIPASTKRLEAIAGAVEHCRQGLLEDLAADRLVLATLPSAAARVRSLAESNESSVDEIVNAVTLDPALGAQLMRVANSAYYGGGKVRDLSAAIARLGTRALQHIVMLVLVSRLFDETVDERLRERLDRAWAKSLRTAVLAETLAVRFRVCEPAEAMLAGLLSEIGVLPVLAWAIDVPHVDNSPGLLDAVIDKVRSELGRAMLERWGYPAEFLAVVGAARLAPALPPVDMVGVVNTANGLADYLGDEAALSDEMQRLGVSSDVASNLAERAAQRLVAFTDATVQATSRAVA